MEKLKIEDENLIIPNKKFVYLCIMVSCVFKTSN